MIWLILSLLGLVLPALCDARLCQQDDVKFLFTPCSPATGEMNSVAYLDAQCTLSAGNGTFSLPGPRSTPCIKPCDSGTWYSPASLNCENCPAGTISNSGGLVINDFTSFPKAMTTYCEPTPCKPWTTGAGGDFLSSGNNSHLLREDGDESVRVTLSTFAFVINPRGGLLRFLYRVESELHFDGLLLYLNATLQKGTNPEHSPFLLTGYQKDWLQYEVKLPVGTTEIRWVYQKDRNQDSTSGANVGSDSAYLRDILIEGVQMFAPVCVPCAAGKFSPIERSLSCQSCPIDTFSAQGASRCIPCSSDQWAPPGSSSCRPREPCRTSDYLAVYTTCDPASNTRERSWQLANSRCSVKAGSAPTADRVPCAGCPEGFRSVGGSCQQCPAGQVAAKDGSCSSCSAGTYAGNALNVDFDDLAVSGGGFILPALDNRLVFTMKCEGLCQSCPAYKPNCVVWNAGYTLTPILVNDADNTAVVLRSDLSNGARYRVSLFANFTSVGPAVVEFHYYFFRPYNTGADPIDAAGYSGYFFVDGQLHDLSLSASTYDRRLNAAAYPFTNGAHTLEIVFEQQAIHNNNDPVALVITDLRITGDISGGASKCTPCPGGSYCPEKSANPTPCPAGTANFRSQATSINQCEACTGDEIAARPGSYSCYNCGTGTVPNKAHTECVNSCNLTVDLYKVADWEWVTQTYDLTPFKGMVFGPLFVPEPATPLNESAADANNAQRFYISPCDFVNAGANDHICKFHDGLEVQDAYVCQRFTQNISFAAGDTVRYQVHEQGIVSIFYAGGDKCNHGGMERSTNLTLVCDPTVKTKKADVRFVGEFPHCQYNFEARTPHACPLCTEDSYQKSVGECRNDSKREVVYYKSDPTDICYGGFAPPANGFIPCDRCQPEYYTIVWGECVNNTQSAIATLKPEHRDCIGSLAVNSSLLTERHCATIDIKLGWNSFTLFFAIFIPFVSVLIAAVIIIYFKHKALKHKFERLSTREDVPTELYDVPDTSVEDPDAAPTTKKTNGTHLSIEERGTDDKKQLRDD